MATSQAGPILFSNDKYEIRPAVNNDEFRAMWWKFMLDLGWNRGYHDLDTYMNYSHGYGVLLLLDKTCSPSKPVGHVSAIINDNKTGWVAMFIVDAAHRGHGMGAALFKACMADFARHGVSITGLDAVAEQKKTYERRNFIASPLGQIHCLIRPLPAQSALDPAPRPPNTHLLDLAGIPGDVLAQHERQYTGFYRPRLWSRELMFSRPDARGFALTTRAEPVGPEDLVAWTLVRRCPGGFRVGPLYAADVVAAKAVLVAAVEALATPDAVRAVPLPGLAMHEGSVEKIAEEATVVVEVWGGNAAAVELFEGLRWKDSGVELYRMWVDGKATAEQQGEDGVAQRGVFAIFDGAVG